MMAPTIVVPLEPVLRMEKRIDKLSCVPANPTQKSDTYLQLQMIDAHISQEDAPPVRELAEFSPEFDMTHTMDKLWPWEQIVGCRRWFPWIRPAAAVLIRRSGQSHRAPLGYSAMLPPAASCPTSRAPGR